MNRESAAGASRSWDKILPLQSPTRAGFPAGMRITRIVRETGSPVIAPKGPEYVG